VIGVARGNPMRPRRRDGAKEDAKMKAKISGHFFFVLFVPFVDKNPEFHWQSAG
jgi:hypothetical protein